MVYQCQQWPNGRRAHRPDIYNRLHVMMPNQSELIPSCTKKEVPNPPHLIVTITLNLKHFLFCNISCGIGIHVC